MDLNTLLAGLDFSRSRLLGLLETIEKSGQDLAGVLAWRPGPGRAHIAWQAMHCAATHDRYLNVGLKGGAVNDQALVAAYAGGSTPSDTNVPSLADIRSTLETTYGVFRNYVAALPASELSRMMASKRTVEESLLLMAWHEAHHQGQIHLTWNLYKQAHGVT
ncbi:MAG TPA: DinB family protein [Tepidisphaeraceae bacterium]|jgi:hypothetical protein|nr:DinB family protein [Tepidisphaeraceae bacterium]